MSDPLLGQQRGSSSVQVRFGDVVLAAGVAALNIAGVVQGARWSQAYVPVAGDAVAVAVIRDEDGQSSNLVLGKVGATAPTSPPDEAVVTSVPASSPTITVAAAGVSYRAKVALASPTVGDRVLLLHRPDAIYAIARVQSTPAPLPVPPPPPPPPPPGGPSSGTDVFGASDSATARSGSGWNSTSGQNLTQGTWAGVAYTGSWFYGTGPGSLAGRGIRAARLYLPARRRIGNYGSPVVVHVYAHTSSSRPGGDVTRVAGPHDVTLPPGWGGGWVDIPQSLAAVVIGGGGLGIAGGGTPSYAGFPGRDADPQSGAIAIDWSL